MVFEAFLPPSATWVVSSDKFYNRGWLFFFFFMDIRVSAGRDLELGHNLFPLPVTLNASRSCCCSWKGSTRGRPACMERQLSPSVLPPVLLLQKFLLEGAAAVRAFSIGTMCSQHSVVLLLVLPYSQSPGGQSCYELLVLIKTSCA